MLNQLNSFIVSLECGSVRLCVLPVQGSQVMVTHGTGHARHPGDPSIKVTSQRVWYWVLFCLLFQLSLQETFKITKPLPPRGNHDPNGRAPYTSHAGQNRFRHTQDYQWLCYSLTVVSNTLDYNVTPKISRHILAYASRKVIFWAYVDLTHNFPPLSTCSRGNSNRFCHGKTSM